MKHVIRSTTPAILAMAFAIAAAGQTQQQSTPQPGQQQTQQQNPPAQENKPSLQGQSQGTAQTPAPAQAPKVDPAEESAYKEFAGVKPDDFDQQVKLGEDFVKKYPESRYRVLVYDRLTTAYYSKQQMDKMYEVGEKALTLNPNDVQVLVLVGWVLPHNYDPNDPQADQRLAKAEAYEKHALEILPTLTKPATLTDEQFNAAKAQDTSMAHSGLGLTYFRQQKAQDSLNELQQATTGDKPDPVDFFIMGIDLDSLKRYNDAAQAFDKCAQIPGVMQDRCKQQEAKSKTEATQSPK